MNQELYIKNALKEFNVTDSAIAELEKKYSDLKINGLEDKQGYAIVRTARLDIKTRRIEVDKKRKELNEVALNHQRQVNAEAKRIMALLLPIEDYLETQEKEFEAEKERAKKEKERLEQEKATQRVKKLLEIGFIFDGLSYKADYTYPGIRCLNFDIPIATISVQQLKEASDDKFDKEYAYFCAKNAEKKDYLAEEKRKQEEIGAKLEAERLEAQRKEAEERRIENEQLEAIRLEQKIERERLESIACEQTEKEAYLKAEQEKIEHQKKNIFESVKERLSQDVEPIFIVSRFHEQDSISTPATSNINAESVENAKTGFKEAMAAGSITGSRGDRVIIDDPLIDTIENELTLKELFTRLDDIVEWFSLLEGSSPQEKELEFLIKDIKKKLNYTTGEKK